jgi:hypothetical protein
MAVPQAEVSMVLSMVDPQRGVSAGKTLFQGLI